MELDGLPLATFVEALRARGLKAGPNPYPPLHLLPYFGKGFDLYTGGRGPLVEGWEATRQATSR